MAEEEGRAAFSRTGGASWLLAAWLFVVSVKLIHIHAFGLAMPITDMWNAEGELYLKAHAGTLSWSDIVAPHNEHRIAFTRLLDLALLGLNGQWDNRLQCVVGAALDAAIGTLLGISLWLAAARPFDRSSGSGPRRAHARLWALPALGLSAAVFAAPFSQNDLIGFNSQYRFVLGFAVLTIWLMGLSRPFSAPWWIGVLAAVCSLFTAGSGLLAAAVVGMLAVLGWSTGTSRASESLVNLGASATVLGLGIALTVRVPGSQALHAQSLRDFLVSFAKGAALPYLDRPAMAIVMWLPFLLLLATLVTRSSDDAELGRLLVGLGLWVLAQAAAVAYSRGANGGGPDARHLDLLKPALIVNGVGALLLCRRAEARRAASWVGPAAVAGWFLVAAWGAYRLADEAVGKGSAGLHAWCAERERNVRAFVVSEGRETLDGKSIPFPEWGRSLIRGYLENPYVRSILPAELRGPSGAPAAEEPAGRFARRRDVGYLSWLARGAARSGPLLCAASLWWLLVLYFLWGSRRTGLPSPLESGGE